MTKTQELDLLDATIEAYGRDSYLGPWLQDVKGEVEREVTSDFTVTPTLTETRRTCERMLADAKTEAETIITRAKSAVKAMTDKAHEENSRWRQYLLNEIHKAEKALTE